MNLNAFDLSQQRRNITEWNSSAENATRIEREQLILSDSESQNWDISVFWKVSVPLAVCTIMAPLMIGAILRKAIQVSSRHQTGLEVTTILYCIM